MINAAQRIDYELCERDETVLKWVIRDYVNAGAPVGSRRLAAMDSFDLSPASLRQVLHRLESAGYLFQPHTSAGRVPTERGYRYFVDRLMRKEMPLPEQTREYESTLDRVSSDLDLLIRNTTQFLGEMAQALVLMSKPRRQSQRIRSLALHELDADTILLIVHMSLDQIKTIAFELETGLSRTMLREAENLLNQLFADTSLEDVRAMVASDEFASTRKQPLLDHIFSRFEALLNKPAVDDFKVYGTHQLLHYPELNVPGDLERLLEAIENQHIQQYLPAPGDQSPRIMIGSELGQNLLSHMSLVSVAYKGTNCQGEIHILGPTRMAYERNIGLVEYTAASIENIINMR
jgi:heat-inducible transcriptional repressor